VHVKIYFDLGKHNVPAIFLIYFQCLVLSDTLLNNSSEKEIRTDEMSILITKQREMN